MALTTMTLEDELERTLNDVLATRDYGRVFELLDSLETHWRAGPTAARALDRAIARATANAEPSGWGATDLARAIAKVLDREVAKLVERPGAVERLWRAGRSSRHNPVKEALLALVWATRLPHDHPMREVTAGDDIDVKVLHRVRSLLAKAESTTFEAESLALTAKAHALMTQYTIDAALIDGRHQGGRSAVTTRRIFLEDPHAASRFHLLAKVARANSCRALWTKHLGLAIVYGYSSDLQATELLYTSLMLQATMAMDADRPQRAAPAHVAAYRRSFLYAFTARVAQRLHEAREATVAAAAETSSDLLPILASRSDAVEAALAADHPDTRKVSLTTSDPAGWRAGDEAGARASLDTATALGERKTLSR